MVWPRRVRVRRAGRFYGQYESAAGAVAAAVAGLSEDKSSLSEFHEIGVVDFRQVAGPVVRAESVSVEFYGDSLVAEAVAALKYGAAAAVVHVFAGVRVSGGSLFGSRFQVIVPSVYLPGVISVGSVMRALFPSDWLGV